MSKQLTLYFNNSKLYLIANELIEININLIDHIQKNSHLFKIVKNIKTDLPISKYIIQTIIDLETYINQPNPIEKINYYRRKTEKGCKI